MALRDSKAFLVFAWSIAALALASFVLRVIFAMTSGAGTASYVTASGIPWHYSSAFIVLLAAGVVLFGGFVAWVWRRIRRRSPGDEA